jgi:membrane protein DedA with SNARE-associated domain
MYAIGYHWGHGLLKEHPRFAKFLHADREAKFEQMLNRHGLKVLFLARFMVGVRSPVYLSAGILRISFRRFLLLDLFAATVVVGVFFGLTYVFGEAIAAWIRDAEWWLTGAVLAIVAVVGLLFYMRRRKRMARLVAVQLRRSERAEARENRRVEDSNRNVAHN